MACTCGTQRNRSAIIAAVLLLMAFGAAAQSSHREAERARIYGALVHTTVSLDAQGIPAREFFVQLSRALDVTIVGRFVDDRVGERTGSGLDPDQPIHMRLEQVDGRMALELILEQCELYEACTWQIRRGFIEVGPKARLGAPAARERRVYPVTDLLLEPPYFYSDPRDPPAGVADFADRPYATAALTIPAEVSGGAARKSPDHLLDELIRGIVETIEPGNWDYGQSDDERNDDHAVEEEYARSPAAASRTAPSRSGSKIAQLRTHRNLLIITAPDFVHRQLSDSSRVIPPPPMSEEERKLRSDEASSELMRITVHSRTPRGRTP